MATMYFLMLSLLVGGIDSLELQGIALSPPNVNYAQLNEEAALQCQHSLGEGQELLQVEWMKEGETIMTWSPPEAPTAVDEMYMKALDLSVTDGSLALKMVSTESGGAYTCIVQTKDFEKKTSAIFNLFVADVPSEGFSMVGNIANCSLHFSFTAPAIYPKPTPVCGVWTADTEYTELATDWQAVPYYNGSVAYSIDGTTFNVRSMPLQSGVRCEMSFLGKSGNLEEEQKMVVWQKTAYYPQVSERGCQILEVGEGLQIHYNNHRQTCKSELTAQNKEERLTATVSCSSGLYSTIRGGSVSSVDLVCNTSPFWEVDGDLPWYEFEQMECSDTPLSGSVISDIPPPTTVEDTESSIPSGVMPLTSTSALPMVLMLVVNMLN